MGRPRSKPLPTGLYQRGGVIWCWFVDQRGERRFEAAGRSLEEAKRHRAQRLREVSEGTYRPGARTGASGLGSYADEWIELRRSEGVRSVEREAQLLRDHIVPHLGHLRLDEVRPPLLQVDPEPVALDAERVEARGDCV